MVELDKRIAALNLEDEEIERSLYLLMPARVKTDAPIVPEDYRGEVGEAKHREWDRLMTRREALRTELRECEGRVYRLSRIHKESD
jgi:hypothetical protein